MRLANILIIFVFYLAISFTGISCKSVGSDTIPCESITTDENVIQECRNDESDITQQMLDNDDVFVWENYSKNNSR